MDIHNPWRESLENCAIGDNYLRSREYHELADFIDMQLARITELEARQVPEVLYDGYTVYSALSEAAKKRTSADNVSDVLDAVVKLLRAPSPADSGEVKAKPTYCSVIKADKSNCDLHNLHCAYPQCLREDSEEVKP